MTGLLSQLMVTADPYMAEVWRLCSVVSFSINGVGL